MGTIKLGAIVGGAYAAGSIGGIKVAQAVNVTNPAAVKGVQIATGVIVFVILSAVLA